MNQKLTIIFVNLKIFQISKKKKNNQEIYKLNKNLKYANDSNFIHS